MKKMKMLLQIVLVFVSHSAFAATTIREMVRYSYGNQITHSEISVLSNGLVLVRNRTQATYNYMPNIQLKKSDLAVLSKNVDIASQEESTYKEGFPSSFGSSSGQLTIYASNNKSAIIFALGFGEENNGGLDKISEVNTVAGNQIKKLIQAIAKDKMPLN